MNRTKLFVYAVAAVAIVAVFLGLAQDRDSSVWGVLPAVLVAVHLAGRDRSCARRRGEGG